MKCRSARENAVNSLVNLMDEDPIFEMEASSYETMKLVLIEKCSV